MKRALLDTDTISYFLRADPQVVKNAKNYLYKFGQFDISIISYYEISSGLQFRDSGKLLAGFNQFVSRNKILTLTTLTCNKSAEIYSVLRKQGNPLDDIDLLIAGIAMSNNLDLVTNNTAHFSRIPGLSLQNWKHKA